MDGPPNNEKTPFPDRFGGQTGNGAEVSTVDTSGDHKGDSTPKKTADQYAQERYSLDTQVKRLLRADALRLDPKKHAANTHRTVGCTWIRVADVELVRPLDRETFHFKGLMTCGSVWSCPICSAKIQERRRQEVGKAISYFLGIGKQTIMVSYTFPHRIDESLVMLRFRQQQAMNSMRASGSYKQLMLDAGYSGRIRSLEVTHGVNGWHPHTHELLGVNNGINVAGLSAELTRLWLKACKKAGLFQPGRDDESSFGLHAVDVRSGDEGAASYLAKLDDQTKWGMSHELTKSSSKSGRRAGVHPFKLASQASTSALFIEYVHAMKGQQQLVWSRGLKSAVGIEEKTDEEIATEEVAKVNARIPVDARAWRIVLGNDARWELTHAAKIGGALGVSMFLTALGYVDESG